MLLLTLTLNETGAKSLACQASIVSFVGLFQLLGVVFLVVVPLVLLMKRPRAASGPAAAAH